MPLIVLTGYPSSGKSTRCQEIKQFLETNCHSKVIIVSEEETLQHRNFDKNEYSSDSKKQKEIRALMKCNVIRLLGSNVVLLDASNNIKGFRYELYCAAKCHKTNYCVVECEISIDKAWSLNEGRENGKYSREAFDNLISLFEPPSNNNRWDSPLITVQLEDELPIQQIRKCLFDCDAPLPNLSTQNVPLCNSTYLSELDKVTKDVVNTILRMHAGCVNDDTTTLSISGLKLVAVDSRINSRSLANLKKQFISLHKLHPLTISRERIAELFVQFINSSIPVSAIENVR